MKFYSTLALATIAAVSFSAGRAAAHDVDHPINFSGAVQMSEISVVKDGKTVTYDIPARLAAQFSMSSIGTSMSLGLSSRCGQFLGETATELRHKVTGLKAFKSIEVTKFDYKREDVDVPDSITVVIPKGSRVSGTLCGESKTVLSDLTIRSPEDARIVFDEKP